MMKLFKTRARREQELREWFVKTRGAGYIVIPHLIDYIVKGDIEALERAEKINRELTERELFL